MTAPRRRRWFRFSLRALLVIVAVFCLCGAYAQWVKRSLADGWQREQSIVRGIDALGGWIAYKSITPSWLRPLLTQGEEHFGERISVVEFNANAGGRKNYTQSCLILLRQCGDLSEVSITGNVHNQADDSETGLDFACLEHELPHVSLVLTLF